MFHALETLSLRSVAIGLGIYAAILSPKSFNPYIRSSIFEAALCSDFSFKVSLSHAMAILMLVMGTPFVL